MLGSFHTFMNLLGAVGTLMAGSGLSNILCEIYGENAVIHMMSGKAVQRSFRGHLLMNKCLNKLIVSEMIDEQPELAPKVSNAEDIYNSLIKGRMAMNDVQASETLSQLASAIDSKRDGLRARSKTIKLWLGYQEMVTLAMSLLKADRTGNWQMHLQTLFECLPIFAAAGHFNYLKSVYYYVQRMLQLEYHQPELFRRFQEGHHVIRRSRNFWAGLRRSCD